MIKLTTTVLNIKTLLIILLVGASFFLLSSVVFAQSNEATESVDEVKDLQFPISELGNCSDYNSCLTYCDDPVNNAACIDFAKKKGFYKDDPIMAPTDSFWKEAKSALGCDSQDSCLAFCSQQENFDKCDQFSKSKDITGGYVENPEKKEFLEKAKQILGCDSAVSCSNFCDNKDNVLKCDQFAKEVGLLGGQINEGPGGCTSESTCKSYCSDPQHFNSCSQFSSGGEFKGPGGCSSPGACRSYCEQNPQDCRSYAPGSNGAYVPASCPAGQYYGPGGACTSPEKTGEASQCAQGGKYWDGGSCKTQAPPGISPTGGAFYQPRPEMGNCKTPGECYDYCKENPGKCAGFDTKSEKPKEAYIPTLYYTPGTEVKFNPKSEMGNCDSPGKCYDYCKENPGKCGGFDSKSPRPVDIYIPLTYYTPPTDYQYFTPPATNFYVTPIYYTPPQGSTYATPSYYTPGTYTTPSYYTPLTSNYTTPTYYTPGSYYSTPVDGTYLTPTYPTPRYYTPPQGSNYTTPTYYTPPTYITPSYYTPSNGSYTTPSYVTPPPYNTPSYYTPYSGGSYTTPVYYTPPAGSNYTTPTYASPSYPTPGSNYSYPTPSGTYNTPSYYTPSESGYYYPTPSETYNTPSYGTPSYGTPVYNTPTYGTPEYSTPSYGTPSYVTPSEGGQTQGVSVKRNLFEQVLDLLKISF